MVFMVNNIMVLKCAGCGYKAPAKWFIDGICPMCQYEGQIPVDGDEE